MPFAPLPGTEPPTRGLFIDRWGTLLAALPGATMDDFTPAWFFPGAVDALFRAARADWRIYLIGNEEEVAFGRASEETWKSFEARLLEHLSGQGVRVTRNYACLDHAKGKGARRRRSVFQLPDTGLLYHAAQEDGLTLAECWVIGDGPEELAAGARAGCRTLQIRRGAPRPDLHVEPDLTAPDLASALAEVLTLKVYAAARQRVRSR
jgi:D-glycero-D-manno-heptose 1,7-bisphosphate phosphatase